MSLTETLVPIIIDKVILSGIAAIAAVVYGRYRSERDRATALAERLKLESEERLRLQRVSDMNSLIVRTLERLNSVLFPLKFHMEKDELIWKCVYKGELDLPIQTKALIEREYIIPNHQAAVDRIEKYYQMLSEAEEDDNLRKELGAYVKHVALLRCLRAAGEARDPYSFGVPFPCGLTSELDKKIDCDLKILKETRAELLRIQAGTVHPPILTNAPDDTSLENAFSAKL